MGGKSNRHLYEDNEKKEEKEEKETNGEHHSPLAIGILVATTS
ncbi:MAG: hypothetical protein RL113_205 [Pseudomonadota bacterium]|jgi:hypothetical protein